jgi:GNAT superfamily N-acetyltransferase
MGMDLKMKSQYWDDPKARQAFKNFMIEIHDLDFTEWETAGYWDYAYTPFSFFEGDAVVASVCLYLLDAVIDGKETHLAQISGVGTLPHLRRQGLNRELTEAALEWAQGKHEGVFLFSDPEAIPFYEKCGFRPIEELQEVMGLTPVPQRTGIVQLDCDRTDHLKKIYAYAQRREPVSNRLGIHSSRLLMFHALYLLRDAIYEIPDLGCLVIFRREGDTLHLFDIISDGMPTFDAVYRYLSESHDRSVDFHFFTDKLGLDGTEVVPLGGNHPFVGDGFPLKDPVFPYTSLA